MESNDELKEIHIKNRTCYHFNDIIKTKDFDFSFIGAKPLCIRFDKVDVFIRVYDPTRYLELFGPEKYDAIFN